MKTSLKIASLAALTAATLALPAAAADMKETQAKCQPKASIGKCEPKCDAKCAGKCAPKKLDPAKHAKAKCGAKCAPKCAAKN